MDHRLAVSRRRAFAGLAGVSFGWASPPAIAAQMAAAPPPDEPVEMPVTESDSGSLYPFLERLARETEFSHSFLGNRFNDVNEYRWAGRNLLFESLGYRPPPVNPQAKVVHRVETTEFIREKVVFFTAPGCPVPAYLHIPKGITKPAPAIVDLHSHGGMFLFGKEKVIDFGQNHPVMVEYHQRNYGGRPTATALVRRGYVVITIDAFAFGERRLMLDRDREAGWERSGYAPETVVRLNAVCRQKEATLARSLAFAGITWPGMVAWDDIRTVDYLITRPEVDPSRIGCMGVSMGGYRSMFLGGLDERIAAAVVVGFMSTVKPMIRRHIDTHSFVHFVPALHRYLDFPDVAALRAPRPLLVQQCRRDGLFPPEGMREAVEKLAAIYRKAGAADEFAAMEYDVPHQFDQQMQEDAFRWLDRQLQS